MSDEFNDITINLLFGNEYAVDIPKGEETKKGFVFTILSVSGIEFMSEGAFANVNTEAILEEFRFVARKVIPFKPIVIEVE